MSDHLKNINIQTNIGEEASPADGVEVSEKIIINFLIWRISKICQICLERSTSLWLQREISVVFALILKKLTVSVFIANFHQPTAFPRGDKNPSRI